jgi:hypothetical protein
MKFNESPYVIPEALIGISEEASLAVLRGVRDACLAETDWTQLPDSPLTEAKRAEWAIYRQALRDITETYVGNLLEVYLPDKPSAGD